MDHLLSDAGIVRHRGKIEAAIANAQAALDLQRQGDSLEQLLWGFAPEGADPAPQHGHELASQTPESTALSKRLREAGFRFVGPTTAYSLMQAAGIVNDHLAGCAFRD